MRRSRQERSRRRPGTDRSAPSGPRLRSLIWTCAGTVPTQQRPIWKPTAGEMKSCAFDGSTGPDDRGGYEGRRRNDGRSARPVPKPMRVLPDPGSEQVKRGIRRRMGAGQGDSAGSRVTAFPDASTGAAGAAWWGRCARRVSPGALCPDIGLCAPGASCRSTTCSWGRVEETVDGPAGRYRGSGQAPPVVSSHGAHPQEELSTAARTAMTATAAMKRRTKT